MDVAGDYLSDSLEALTALRAEPQHRRVMADMAALLASRVKEGRKLLVCGNGGSAADAQHIAGEFVSRMLFDRAPLPAIALTTDSSILTATANDYGYEQVFERQVLALGNRGDVLLAISTSGRSANVIRALQAARTRGVECLGFTGRDAGSMQDRCDLLLQVPSEKTPIVQQLHMVAAHIICVLVERMVFETE